MARQYNRLTVFFEYRGYPTTCTVEVPLDVVDKAIQDKIKSREEWFSVYGYDVLFDEYKKVWNKSAIKNRTLMPNEFYEMEEETRLQREKQQYDERMREKKVAEPVAEPAPYPDYWLIRTPSNPRWVSFNVYTEDFTCDHTLVLNISDLDNSDKIHTGVLRLIERSKEHCLDYYTMD